MVFGTPDVAANLSGPRDNLKPQSQTNSLDVSLFMFLILLPGCSSLLPLSFLTPSPCPTLPPAITRGGSRLLRLAVSARCERITLMVANGCECTMREDHVEDGGECTMRGDYVKECEWIIPNGVNEHA